MKVFEIMDKEEGQSIGCLLYFEKEKSYIVELQDHLDEWTAPLLFASTVKKGNFTIGRDLSYAWVCERVIPSGRQNIDSILANAKMSVYDESLLLEKAAGICSQDSNYVRRINFIPEYVRQRMEYILVECIPCDDMSLLCFFADGKTRKIPLSEITENRDIKKIVSNVQLFQSGHIAAGGYCVTFNDSIDIDAGELYGKGIELPLQLKDFIFFVQRNVVDASGCCEILQCTRQNLINYLSKDILTPIREDVRGNLYTKGEIYRSEINYKRLINRD